MLLSEIGKWLNKNGYATILIKDAILDTIGESVGKKKARTLRFLSNMKYLDRKLSQAEALLVNNDIDILRLTNQYNGGILLCDDAKECIYALNIFLPETTGFWGEAFKTSIDHTAEIGKNVTISDKNVRIGHHVVIEDQVIIHSNVEIGPYSKIGSGTILGSEGVMLCNIKGEKRIVPHCGRLIIGEKVTIMNHTIVQKGINNAAHTAIGNGAVIGSGCLISHGTEVEADVLILDHVDIAGYCLIGRNTFIGAGCIFKNGLEIGRDVHISPGSILIDDVSDNAKISGFFAVDRKKSLKIYETNK